MMPAGPPPAMQQRVGIERSMGRPLLRLTACAKLAESSMCRQATRHNTSPVRQRQPPHREAVMFSKINHVAIVSENYAKSALFYQAVFGMRTSDKTRPGRAQTVGDG